MRRHPHSFDLSADFQARKQSSSNLHAFHRRNLNIGPLSQTSSIIVVVCIAVAGILLVVIFIRIISRRSSRSQSAPLPPRQELAHQREHQLARLAEDKLSRGYEYDYARPNTWLQADSAFASSSASLIPTTPSVGTQDDMHSERESDALHSANLHPYHPRLGTNPPSSTGSLSTEPSPLPSPQIPSAGSSRNASPSRRSSRVSASGLSSHPSRRTPLRPVSSRMSGVPHSPHSNVQIVLPTPLAPQLYQHSIGSEDSWGRRISHAEDSRQSLAMSDAWVSVTAGISTDARRSIRQGSSSGGNRRAAPSDARSVPPSAFSRRSSSVPPLPPSARPTAFPIPPTSYRESANHDNSVSHNSTS